MSNSSSSGRSSRSSNSSSGSSIDIYQTNLLKNNKNQWILPPPPLPPKILDKKLISLIEKAPEDIKKILYQKSIELTFCEKFKISEKFFEKYKKFIFPKKFVVGKPIDFGYSDDPYLIEEYGPGHGIIKDPEAMHYDYYRSKFYRELEKSKLKDKNLRELAQLYLLINFLYRVSPAIQEFSEISRDEMFESAEEVEEYYQRYKKSGFPKEFAKNLVKMWKVFKNTNGKYYWWNS